MCIFENHYESNVCPTNHRSFVAQCCSVDRLASAFLRSSWMSSGHNLKHHKTSFQSCVFEHTCRTKAETMSSLPSLKERIQKLKKKPDSEESAFFSQLTEEISTPNVSRIFSRQTATTELQSTSSTSQSPTSAEEIFGALFWSVLETVCVL